MNALIRPEHTAREMVRVASARRATDGRASRCDAGTAVLPRDLWIAPVLTWPVGALEMRWHLACGAPRRHHPGHWASGKPGRSGEHCPDALWHPLGLLLLRILSGCTALSLVFVLGNVLRLRRITKGVVQ